MEDQNLILYIKKKDGTSFHDLRLNKFTYTTTVMSLNTKIEGDFYYKDNSLEFTLAEYVEYKGAKYTLKNPPVVVKKGTTSDNSELKGMTKYTCTFFHEEIELYNIPFTDVAIDNQEVSYRSEKRTFSWIGTVTSLVSKINQCFKGTKWTAAMQPDFKDDGEISKVLSFNNQFISDACKTVYETFKVPFVIDGYKILFGKPSNEILGEDGKPYIFQLGQGVGLKNNDVTPKNNKVITRIAGQGSDQNLPYGYPIIKDEDGKVIDHPYTRDHLMPSVYIKTLREKLLFKPSTILVDYYDADKTYPTPLNPLAPVFHIQEFDIKPSIEGMIYKGNAIDSFKKVPIPEGGWDDYINPETGDVRQSYFDVTLYPLGFDIYAQAAVTSAMTFSMKSGNTLGANFEVGVDWEDVKKNFYITDKDGNIVFAPNGEQRDFTKYPNSTNESITLKLKKDLDTFGTLIPNKWQYPVDGDKFVILGIKMPQEYVDTAQDRLDAAMKKYMLENNIPLLDYPLDFDEFFLTNNPNILNQIKTNTIVRFKYGGELLALSVKDISVKYGSDKLPKYDITLTDEVSIVLNQIGQVADGLSKLGSQVAALQALYGVDIYAELNKKLSKVSDDTSTGKITSTKAFQVGSFVTGSTGGIFNVDSLGRSNIEIDYLTVRMKAFFRELEIVKTGVIAGRIIITPGGGIDCTKVEEFDTYYRCYFLVNDGETKVNNRFKVGDQALSESFNIEDGIYSGVSNHYYWRLVVAAGDNYIDLSKTDADTSQNLKSNIPKVGDTICQLGNRTDPARQNALIMSSVDTYSPSLTFYCGINNYSYLDKEYIEYGVDKTTNLAYMNIYGNSYTGARDRSTYIKYDTVNGVEIKGTLVTKTGRDVDQAFNNFQDQIDGVKETFYGEYTPALNNFPANGWSTEKDKERHEGDVFTNIQAYVDDETTPDAGKSWRWVQTDGVWGWNQIADSDSSKAYYEAAKAAKAAEEAKTAANTANTTINSLKDFTDEAFVDGIIDRSEATAIQKYLNTIASIQKDVTESYSKVYVNALLEGPTKTDLKTAYDGFNTATTDLISTINSAIVDGKTTSVEVAAVDGKYNTFNTKYGDFIGYLNAANKFIQDKINDNASNAQKAANIAQNMATEATERLDKWAADGVISPTEKQGLKDEIARIDADKDNIITNFKLYSLGDPTNYNEAYTEYRKGLVALSAISPEIIPIPIDFKDKQSTYYNQRTEALNTIAKATKEQLGQIGTDMDSYEYLKKAWAQNTTVEGGLTFSSLAQFGSIINDTFTVKAGINGIVLDSKPGGGIASWYGGAMKDRAEYTEENMPSDVAKAVIRMDGSGYLANGNVWWGLDGKFHADPNSFLIEKEDIGSYLKLFQVVYKHVPKRVIDYMIPQYPMQHVVAAEYVEIGTTGYRIGFNATNNSLKIYNVNSKITDVVEIDGNLLVTGGVTAYSQGSQTASSILDVIPIDETTLSKEGGKLSVIGGGGAGGGSVDGIILNSTTYSPNEATKLITLPDLVTIDSQQLITGEKTFTNSTRINKHLSIGAVLPSHNWNRAELDVIGIGSYPSDLWLGADGKRMFAITARPIADTDNPGGITFYDNTNIIDFLKYNPANTLLKVQGKSEKVFEVKSTTPNASMQIIGASGKTAEFGTYVNLDAYMQTPFLPGTPTLLLKSDGINSAAFGFNNLHYPLWHDGNISRNVDRIFQEGTKILDLTSYDNNTWYPCSTQLFNQYNASTPCRIVLYNVLDSISHPSWATHAQGFTLMLDMETYAGGWGSIAINTYLNNYSAGFGGETAFGGTEQNNMNSTCILWLRGGAAYKYWTNYDGNIYGNKDGYSWVNGQYSYTATPRSTQGSPLTGFNIMRNRSDLCTLGRHTIRVNDSYDIGIGNNSGYLEVQSAGNEIIMTSGSGDMHVNNRGSSVGAGVPANWYWHQGAPGNWANFYIGNLIINGYNENPVIINTSNPNESSIAYKIQNNLTFIAGSSTNNFFIWAPGKGDLFKAFNDGRVEFNGGSIYFNNNGIYCNNWIRTIGNSGWYNETYHGGIYMKDNQYIRIYDNKHFRVEGKISCGEHQDDAYGYMNVTRPNNDSYCCYAFVRGGVQAYGIGYNTNNEIVIGFPNGNSLWTHQALRISSSGMTLSGNFLATGGVTAQTASDINLKKDFDTKIDYRKKILKLGNVVDFSYNDVAISRMRGVVDNKRHTSIIYQNALNAEITDFCHPLDEDGYGYINPICPDLIFTIVGAVQKNIKLIDSLKAKVKKLEKKIERLEEQVSQG